MKGLELSRAYFEECGLPVLKSEFSEILPLLAIGLVGSGSECFGFDDELSTDHDFEPGFCVFLPDEAVVDRRSAFLLERAYSKLPKTFNGFSKSLVSPAGGSRHGVIRTADFYLSRCGSQSGDLSVTDWLSIPEYSLAETVNGEIFYDGYGEFSEIRGRLSAYPDDIRKKKLAGYLLNMEQAGQYNYGRCVKRGDNAAAQMAVFEFVNAFLHVAFLINRKYMPYYKWAFRAFSELPKFSELREPLEYMLSSDNGDENAALKSGIIDDIAKRVVLTLKNEGLSSVDGGDLGLYARAVNKSISDGELRNMSIFAGV